MTGTDHVGEFYWHVHHEILCELLTDPLQSRIDFIKHNKPENEVPVRLELLTPVLHHERLPSEWKEAYRKQEEAYRKRDEAYRKREEAYRKRGEADRKWGEADRKWGEADRKRGEADRKREEADQKWKPQIEALHHEEHPDCPWNGKTIFP